MDEERKKLLIELLKKVDPKKPYGTELFNALARLTISVAIEMVCLRHIKGKEVEVYLTQRSPDDSAYPEEWHCPGSFIQPGEEINETIARITQTGIKMPLSTMFIANVNHLTEARGHVLSIVYLCELQLLDNAGDWYDFPGTWFPVDELPEKTVESHRRRIIPPAFKAFVAADTSICT